MCTMKNDIKIPLEIVSEANLREHWSKGYKRHKRQKYIVRLELLAHEIPQTLPVKITLTRYAPRKFDSDNLQSAFKYIRDAVSEHFISDKAPGRADDDSRFEWHYDQIKSAEKSIRLSFDWPEPLQTQAQDQLCPQSPYKVFPEFESEYLEPDSFVSSLRASFHKSLE